ncbi:MAG: type 2 isopentenyl-diphosphate Delta-isomerase [Methanomassiliicoccales archaeon]|nr:type 2 isopentenyl-diphosphate Delta-isomerase [Methanomassiliicoccales archaeon]
MTQIQRRKADHIDITMQEDVSSGYNYWDDVKLVHCSLPEVDLEEVDTTTRLFGKRLSMPLVVTAITGGYPRARKINENLAAACAEVQVAMGVGSQRAGLEHGDDGSYGVLKDHDVPLRIGNVGAPQLIPQKGKGAYDRDALVQAMEMVEAHLLAVHLNFLQEVAQPEGDTRAKGCLEAMRAACRELPIIAKETGAGMSQDVARRLRGIGVKGLDVAGTGGTSFSAVEKHRALKAGDMRCAMLGDTFHEWGVPAPVAVVWAGVGVPVIASGGVMDGLQAAKGIALGASAAGMARGILPEALESKEKVVERLRLIQDEFRAAMFLTGSEDVRALGKQRCILTGETREWLTQQVV